MIDYYNIELTPSVGGKDCLGNGEKFDENGEKIDCCCDECDHFMICHKKMLEEEFGYTFDD